MEYKEGKKKKWAFHIESHLKSKSNWKCCCLCGADLWPPIRPLLCALGRGRLMVHNSGIDTSRWLSVGCIVLYTVWTVTSPDPPPANPGAPVWSELPLPPPYHPPPAHTHTHKKRPKQHLTLMLGHKVNDNNTYCGVWNQRSGLLALFSFLPAWFSRDDCQDSEVNEENVCWVWIFDGVKIKEHPVWLYSLTVMRVCFSVCVWMV